MKGARVEMKFSAETVSGTIVSARLAAADEKKPEREQLVLLLDSGDLRTFDLAAASSIRFADPKLQSAAQGLSDGASTSRAPKTSAASTSIRRTPRSARSPPAT